MVTSAAPLHIRHLADIPEALPELAQWFRAEWAPFYGPDGPGDAEADLHASMNRDALPICLVATDSTGSPVGTISLKADSISHRHLAPWGAAFVVVSDHRNQGVGTALLAALENKARELGFRKLHISTDGARAIVERRGWHAIGTAESLRGPITVYETDL